MPKPGTERKDHVLAVGVEAQRGHTHTHTTPVLPSIPGLGYTSIFTEHYTFFYILTLGRGTICSAHRL